MGNTAVIQGRGNSQAPSPWQCDSSSTQDTWQWSSRHDNRASAGDVREMLLGAWKWSSKDIFFFSRCHLRGWAFFFLMIKKRCIEKHCFSLLAVRIKELRWERLRLSLTLNWISIKEMDGCLRNYTVLNLIFVCTFYYMLQHSLSDCHLLPLGGDKVP